MNIRSKLDGILAGQPEMVETTAFLLVLHVLKFLTRMAWTIVQAFNVRDDNNGPKRWKATQGYWDDVPRQRCILINHIP